ncbi:hypothetical protein AAHA92_14753 [Salvia divinorum]|uniref:Myb-like domain-containing protein n=1 Tax=Salvia divinorum TaxID=28513 RepID=A0ABD1HCJ9_SALDI
MGEEGEADNMNQNNEEKIKQKNKDKKSSAKSVVEVHTEYDRTSENEGISEVKRDHKRGKEKKKMKKSKGSEVVEADMKSGSRKGELNVVSGGELGEKYGEVILEHSESCIASATKIWEEMKKDKKRRKGDNFARSKDTHTENKSDEVGSSSKWQENVLYDVEYHTQSTKEDGDTKNNHETKKKKKHRKKENYKNDLPAARQKYVDSDTNSVLNTKETQNNEAAEFTIKRKKGKTKYLENGSSDERNNEAEYTKKGKRRKTSLVVKCSDDTSPNKSNKKVRFSDRVEVFHLPPKSNTEDDNGEKANLVMGKRFTREEDEVVKSAVMKYIEEHELGDEGLQMIMKSGKHPELKGCWKEIASSIPYRPRSAIYYRARILFMRSESRKWTQEEYDMILKYQEVHGNKWRALADELGKHAWHVKDTWRRIKLRDRKKGNWSQEEYQRLFDLVNTDLQLKLSEEKKYKHGMLRDNICWSAISDELSTRPQSTCCLKWYNQLTSPMVAQGVWADSDDYRLLSALYRLDANCVEDVDWDDLIDTRAGDVCRKRWNQMVLHIGPNGNKSFAEQVEVLAQRYCPHLLEPRETWDSKPRVP